MMLRGLPETISSCVKAVPLVLLSIHSVLLVFSAFCHSPVWDEVVRVHAGCNHWESGDFSGNPGNPPLNDLVAAAPIMLFADSNERKEFSLKFLESEHVVQFVFLGRLAMIPLSVLAGWACFSWSSDLFGRSAGVFVLTLWCFDPLVLAHGALITGDMFSTAAGVVSANALWRWMARPSSSSAVVCGVMLGIAMLSKYVWVIMPLLFSTLWMLRRFTSPRLTQWPLAYQMIIIVVMALYVVNVGYGFDGVLQPLGAYQFKSETLQPIAFWNEVDATSGLAGWLKSIPVPLPNRYIMGIDEIANHVESAPMRTYMHGKFIDGHVWYFYLYGILVKMPLGTLMLLSISLFARFTVREFPRNRHDDLILWLPALSILCIASWVTSYKFLRYIMPMLPFMFVWSGNTVIWAKGGGRWRKPFVWVLIGWSVFSSLAVFPHSLSYFNEAAGGSWNGHAHLLGPSYDYGQDFLFLKKWIESHPQAKPLYVECNNWVDPRIVGVQSTKKMPEFGPEAGWYVLSANVLRGSLRFQYTADGTARSKYEYMESFLAMSPVANAGYSIRIYYLDCAEANRMRSRLGLARIECDAKE